MIGIIGYGMVGKAVQAGFARTQVFISDPQYNKVTVEHLCGLSPDALFVCVPTPTDGTDYSLLKGVLDQIKATGYAGITVVKSTVLPHHLDGYDVVYNPEFLSRATSVQDFVNPPFVLIGGDLLKVQQLAKIYEEQSIVNMRNVEFTDITTAALAKYTMNCFYALKVTYMNAIYDVAQQTGADYTKLTSIIRKQPWMGTHHFDVPGPDGLRGFGGPCLPKDTEALANEYDMALLKKALELNNDYRNS